MVCSRPSAAACVCTCASWPCSSQQPVVSERAVARYCDWKKRGVFLVLEAVAQKARPFFSRREQRPPRGTTRARKELIGAIVDTARAHVCVAPTLQCHVSHRQLYCAAPTPSSWTRPSRPRRSRCSVAARAVAGWRRARARGSTRRARRMLTFSRVSSRDARTRVEIVVLDTCLHTIVTPYTAVSWVWCAHLPRCVNQTLQTAAPFLPRGVHERTHARVQASTCSGCAAASSE